MASAIGRNDTSTSAEQGNEILTPKEPILRWSACRIYEVPQRFRKMKEKAYTPQLVSIGPIHHNDRNLKPMEEQKKIYFEFFKQRLPNSSPRNLSEFKNYLEKNEQNIRKCYLKKYDTSTHEFVTMILLDAVFIMELFLRYEYNQKDDILFTRLWIENGIRRDLALLENQLPMHVLLELFKMYVFCPPTEQGKKIQIFQDLAFRYFKDLNPPSLKDPEPTSEPPSIDRHKLKIYKPQNFTDFIRYCCCCSGVVDDQMTGSNTDEAGNGYCFLPTCDEESKDEKSSTDDDGRTARKSDEAGITFAKHPDKASSHRNSGVVDDQMTGSNTDEADNIYCFLPTCDEKSKDEESSTEVRTARKLDEAGVTFEKHPNEQTLLAIEFQKNKFLDKFPFLSLIPKIKSVKSRLQIPQLTVDDNTECILRNLIALEQCHYPMKAYISNYVFLLDCLIDTKEDVDFLVDKQIIVQQVGSNQEVATLFNNLLKEVCLSSPIYGDRIKRLNKHYGNKWNRLMAKLKSVYFRDLWRGSLTMVGLFVFIFTLFNTIHTFLETILRSGFKFVIPTSLKGSIAF